MPLLLALVSDKVHKGPRGLERFEAVDACDSNTRRRQRPARGFKQRGGARGELSGLLGGVDRVHLRRRGG